MTKIFISHAEEDQELAVALARGLEQSGFHAWYYERDSVPGPPYLDQVCEAIEQCRAFVLLVSPDSLKSRQVDAEVIRAYETEKPFVPLLHDINQVEFQKRKSGGWRLALGAATSIEIPSSGITSLLDQIKTGLKWLGVEPASEPLQRERTDSLAWKSESSKKTVDCTLFAPPNFSPGAYSLVHVWLHTAEQADDIALKSTAFDEDVRRRATRNLGINVLYGTRFSLNLDMGDLEVKPLSTELSWYGEPNAIVFKVLAPPETSDVTKIGQAILLQEGVALASLKFRIAMGAASESAFPFREEIRPFKRAYACYSAQDRVEVVKRTQMLSALGLEMFMDVQHLRSGEQWRDQLHRMIDEADVFLLFWSEAASHSKWVETEWRYAIESKGLNFIHPIVFEPSFPPPPRELSSLHFQPSLAYLR